MLTGLMPDQAASGTDASILKLVARLFSHTGFSGEPTLIRFSDEEMGETGSLFDGLFCIA